MNEKQLFLQFIDHPMIKMLNKIQQQALFSICKPIQVDKKSVIIDENTMGDSIYLLLSGSVSVFKKGKNQRHFISRLTAGDWFGEMILIDEEHRSASIEANEPCLLICINKHQLENNPALLKIKNIIIMQITRKLASRLRYTNSVTIHNMEKKIKLQQEQIIYGSFTVTLTFLLSCYIYFIYIYKSYAYHFPSVIAGIFIILFFFIAWGYFIYRNKLDLKELIVGKTLTMKAISFAVLASIPFIVLIIFMKLVLLYYSGSPIHLNTIFTPFATLPDKYQNLKDYILLCTYYILFCLVQETIARGIIQNSLMRLLKNSSPWWPNIVANLVFSSVHVHKSLLFALTALVPGLFWGWLYSRQNSVITVFISHALIGTIAIFIVGFEVLR